MLIKNALAGMTAAAILLGGVAVSKAVVTIDWGVNFGDEIYTSDGNLADDAIHWELGAFRDGFTPNGNNVELWKDYWIVFDIAPFEEDPYNPGQYIFQREVQMPNDGSSVAYPAESWNFKGMTAYVWGFNDKTYQMGLEWLLYRGEDWVFPDFPTDEPPDLDLEWDVAHMTTTDIPVWGAVGNPDGPYPGYSTQVGLGWASGPIYTPGDPEVSLLQLYTIPEPGTYAVGALMLGAAAFHGWRRRRSRDKAPACA